MEVKVKLSPRENLSISQKVIKDFLSRFCVRRDSMHDLAMFKLFEEISRELKRFIEGRTDLSTTSLQVRNIFELYLITKHVFTDEKGLNNWIGQMHKDSIDIQNGFIELFSNHNENTAELEEIRKFVDDTLEASPYQSKGGFNIRDLADKYGYLNDYLAIHKLCSKLVHPTSIKVNTYDALIEDDNYLKILEHVGVFFTQKLEKLCHEIEQENA